MKRAAAPAKTPKLAARVPLGSNVSTYSQSRDFVWDEAQSHVVVETYVRTALGRVKPATARWVAKL